MSASEAIARLRAAYAHASMDEDDKITRALPALLECAEALRGLHDDTVEYVTLNKLHDADGSPAINNHWMKKARAALQALSQTGETNA